MLFPELVGKRWGYVNMDTLALQTMDAFSVGRDPSKSPFLEPRVMDMLVEQTANALGVDYLYGGWQEDRRNLWRGSYLEKEQKWIHLGIDLWVPEGTKVSTDVPLTIVDVFKDEDNNGGWGGRVIAKVWKEPLLLVYGHLDKDHIPVKVGDEVNPGEVVGWVANSRGNGYWGRHLHIHGINAHRRPRTFEGHDGYAPIAQSLYDTAATHPDPLPYLRLR